MDGQVVYSVVYETDMRDYVVSYLNSEGIEFDEFTRLRCLRFKLPPGRVDEFRSLQGVTGARDDCPPTGIEEEMQIFS